MGWVGSQMAGSLVDVSGTKVSFGSDKARSTARLKHSAAFSATGGAVTPSEPEPEGRGFDTSASASDGSGSPSSYPTPIAPIPAGDHESFVAPAFVSAATTSISRRQSVSSARIHRTARSLPDEASAASALHPAGSESASWKFAAAPVGIERPTFGFDDSRVTNARTSSSNRSHSSARCSQRASDALEFSLEYALAPTYPSSVSAVSVAGMKCPSTTSRAIRASATAKPVASL